MVAKPGEKDRMVGKWEQIEITCEVQKLFFNYYFLTSRKINLLCFVFQPGIISMLLIAHCRFSSGRPLHPNRNNSMCHDVRPCKHPVFDQVRCLVSRLNTSAPELFESYVSDLCYISFLS